MHNNNTFLWCVCFHSRWHRKMHKSQCSLIQLVGVLPPSWEKITMALLPAITTIIGVSPPNKNHQSVPLQASRSAEKPITCCATDKQAAPRLFLPGTLDKTESFLRKNHEQPHSARYIIQHIPNKLRNVPTSHEWKHEWLGVSGTHNK